MPPSTMVLNRPCVIVRRVESDDEFYAGHSEDLADTVCELQQTSRDEPAAEGELSRTTWTVFFPADAPSFSSGDVMLVEDEEYQLQGAAWRARNPRTREVSHIEATAIRTVGPEDVS